MPKLARYPLLPKWLLAGLFLLLFLLLLVMASAWQPVESEPQVIKIERRRYYYDAVQYTPEPYYPPYSEPLPFEWIDPR